MAEKEAKARAEGRSTGVDDDSASGGWARGSVQQPEVVSRAPKQSEEGSGFLSRGNMGIGKPAEEKKDDGPKKPTFTKQVKKEDSTGAGTMTRAGFG
jgi:hypothetical protein